LFAQQPRASATGGTSLCDSIDNRNALHPGPASSTAEIAAHAVGVHHRSLPDQLLSIRSLLDATVAQAPFVTDQWRMIDQMFSDLQSELVNCLLRERGLIFPRVERTIAGTLEALPALSDAIRIVERFHWCSLKLLWKLLDLTACAAPSAWDDGPRNELIQKLSAFRDHYYHYLFEVECLLLRRIVAAHPQHRGRESAATPCPAYVD